MRMNKWEIRNKLLADFAIAVVEAVDENGRSLFGEDMLDVEDFCNDLKEAALEEMYR